MRRTARECRQIVEAIDELRREELWSVQIHNDNPDWGGPENVIHVVIKDAETVRFVRFEGESLLAALEAGVAWKQSIAGTCSNCQGFVFHRPGHPGEFDHKCSKEWRD